ncbi:hypothetical protein HYS48_01700 [Candidatus Woesearchaeota archaeon]|nr:hypothetical protein [Candidatus Woesearchaeota archaeon]
MLSAIALDISQMGVAMKEELIEKEKELADAISVQEIEFIQRAINRMILEEEIKKELGGDLHEASEALETG